MRAALLRTETLSGDMESVTTWNTLLTQSVTILISQLYPSLHEHLCVCVYTFLWLIHLTRNRWPSTHCIALCQFLLSSCQYTNLQVRLVGTVYCTFVYLASCVL